MADPELRGVFRRPFDEQVEALRVRLGNLVGTQAWDDLWQASHDRAFVVAGALKADLLQDLGEAVRKAVEEGASLEEFRRDFRWIVETRGWHGWTGEGTKAGEAWRTRVIYRTNMATSYAAGRMAQLREAGFDLWVYRHGASAEPREQHLAWDGLVLPADHPFWETHTPPNGWGCSCYVTGARSAAGARRVGGDPDKALPDGWEAPDPRTGAPRGIDRGWGYAPGASVAEVLAPVRQKLKRLEPELGRGLLQELLPEVTAEAGARLAQVAPRGEPEAVTPEIVEAWAAEFGDFLDRALSSLPQGRFMVVGALKPEWVEGAKAAGLSPVSGEIAISDRSIRHLFRDAKASPVDVPWFRDLPRHLREPARVLIDPRPGEPAFILVYGLPGEGRKLVVTINFDLKKKRGIKNLVRTAGTVTDNDVATLLGNGVIELK